MENKNILNSKTVRELSNDRIFQLMTMYIWALENGSMKTVEMAKMELPVLKKEALIREKTGIKVA